MFEPLNPAVPVFVSVLVVEFGGAAPPAVEPERRLDSVLAHADSVVAEDETIRELFWGED